MFSIVMIGDEQNMINPYEEEFLFDGHTFGIIYEKGNFWIGFYLCSIQTSSHSFQNIGSTRKGGYTAKTLLGGNTHISIASETQT